MKFVLRGRWSRCSQIGGKSNLGRPPRNTSRITRHVAANPSLSRNDRCEREVENFGGYWQTETPSLRGEWYLTGDTMQRDEDGHFFFVGRHDDIITPVGYRIGPFDVESVLMEHPGIAEVAVIGKPDSERTEIAKAFAVLRRGIQPSSDLVEELQHYVRKRLSLHAYPREIEFLAELPKTPSGKVQRFLLRQGA